MESQQNSPEQAQNQQDQEVAQLEEQLREAVAAENFFETASGKIVVKLLTMEITNLARLLSSDKFLKDHMGYVNTVAKLQANQNLLKRLQLAASPARVAKIQERLDQKENG